MRMMRMLNKALLLFIFAFWVSACGGGSGNGGTNDGGGNADVEDEPQQDVVQTSGEPQPVAEPKVALAVLEDDAGQGMIAVTTELGEGVYLLHHSQSVYDLSTLEAVLYQLPDGTVADLRLDENGYPASLEIEGTTFFYSDYTGDSVTVTVRLADGSEQLYADMPVDPAWLAEVMSLKRNTAGGHYVSKVDRQDVGFMVGFVGTSISIAFCAAPSLSGVGTFLTWGCLGAASSFLATAAGSTELGVAATGSDFLQAVLGDKTALVTGVMGTLSTLLGWESNGGFRVFVSGKVANNENGSLGSAEHLRMVHWDNSAPGSRVAMDIPQSTAFVDGKFFFSKALASGSHEILLQAVGYADLQYGVAITHDRIKITRKAYLPDMADTVVFDQKYPENKSRRLIVLDAVMDKVPLITGKANLAYRDKEFNENDELTEILEPLNEGVVQLLDSQGELVRYGESDLLKQVTFFTGGIAQYAFYPNAMHGDFILQYTPSEQMKPFVNTMRIPLSVRNGASLTAQLPPVFAIEGTTQEFSFVSSHDASNAIQLDIPVTSVYDGDWVITATPEADTFLFEKRVWDAEKEEYVTVIQVFPCYHMTVNVALRGRAGIGELFPKREDWWYHEAIIAADVEGNFGGKQGSLEWSGSFATESGTYVEDSVGEWPEGGFVEGGACRGTLSLRRQ